MDKILAGIVIIIAVGVARAAAVFSNRVMKKIEEDEIAHSKKVAEETEEAFKKVVHQTVKESVDKAMGIKKSRSGNNARY